MSSGTSIIENALQYLNVHSPVLGANAESILVGKGVLNSMIAEWQDSEPPIDMGCVPLNAPGDDLSEPLGARNGIEFNLALYMKPLFKGASPAADLAVNARKTLAQIKRTWGTTAIPKQKVRGTLPKGAGNKHCHSSQVFFNQGDEIG